MILEHISNECDVSIISDNFLWAKKFNTAKYPFLFIWSKSVSAVDLWSCCTDRFRFLYLVPWLSILDLPRTATSRRHSSIANMLNHSCGIRSNRKTLSRLQPRSRLFRHCVYESTQKKISVDDRLSPTRELCYQFPVHVVTNSLSDGSKFKVF